MQRSAAQCKRSTTSMRAMYRPAIFCSALHCIALFCPQAMVTPSFRNEKVPLLVRMLLAQQSVNSFINRMVVGDKSENANGPPSVILMADDLGLGSVLTASAAAGHPPAAVSSLQVANTRFNI